MKNKHPHAAVVLVLGLAMGGRVAPADAANPLPALALLAYMGFISAAAYSLWSMALAANPVSRVAVFGFMNPVFGAVLSALLLGETSVVSPVLASRTETTAWPRPSPRPSWRASEADGPWEKGRSLFLIRLS